MSLQLSQAVSYSEQGRLDIVCDALHEVISSSSEEQQCARQLLHYIC